MAEMKVGRGRIAADFHDERRSTFRNTLQLLSELCAANDVNTPSGQVRELLIEIHHHQGWTTIQPDM